jgi:flagellar P-ring protein precursor FlgI
VSAKGNTGSREVVNHPTVGRIPTGATVEKEVPQKLMSRDGRVTLLLRDGDFNTAKNLVVSINGRFPNSARAIDGLKVEVALPQQALRDPVAFLAQMGDLEVEVKPRAVVVINERTGTIIAGGDVIILPGTITHSTLSISVKEAFDVSQPGPLANGETVVTPRSDVSISESAIPMVPIPKAVGAGEVARALNTLGVSPLDLISIFQSLKKAGLLQAEIITE